jgi:hypothetical protein
MSNDGVISSFEGGSEGFWGVTKRLSGAFIVTGHIEE